MRERVRIDTVYNFDELSEAAQEKVIEHFGQGNLELYDADDLTEQFIEVLKEWGFPTDDIEWSLGYRQGDGVAFYGPIDLDTYAKKTNTIKRARELHFNILRNSWATHYSHFNTMTVEFDYDDDSRYARKLREQIADDVVKVSRELEAIGYAEFDRISSREYILEQIAIGEYEFTIDGNLI